ncbi:hypothetical protein CBM2633_P380013 [Cupriavidus taiwanensis]|uniref:Uncharacterized protein n=2 Tax=Cupriavidus TaxID=106589 RepID=A0A375DAS4_9BURK|nr:hypothetical protein CBM2585_P380012 [Cupriavidus taiwanensis]SOZ40693.1 hypothetical protein CBM2605_P380014 [Cupriavidus neocaledonicus]SOY76613.1 hypothetical protein CBM2588_P420014 [Cupriavidus taiwanensis]SOY76667.1 hypothetical protein CBM2592_P400012 [Cupriavidus taiwanensis]SOY78072.1 hypothetical protein CBM2586_P390014 [Cupriavidus taiwanensis]
MRDNFGHSSISTTNGSLHSEEDAPGYQPARRRAPPRGFNEGCSRNLPAAWLQCLIRNDTIARLSCPLRWMLKACMMHGFQYEICILHFYTETPWIVGSSWIKMRCASNLTRRRCSKRGNPRAARPQKFAAACSARL